MRGDPAVRRAADTYQLGLPATPIRGRAGELLGRGTGSSLEFQEYREYLPGDDVRHLDWAAYARSDSLMVRMYREEVSPITEILLDLSLSMDIGDGAKSWITRQLAALFTLLSGQCGGQPTLRPLDDERPLASWRMQHLEPLATRVFNAHCSLSDLIAEGQLKLKRQSVRVVISDFLFPHDPDALVRFLAADASTLWLIQVLTRWESQPTPIGGRRLLDVERRTETDLVIDQPAIDGYRRRLKRLQDALEQNCRRVQGAFVPIVAESGLADVCQLELARAGILRMA